MAIPVIHVTNIQTSTDSPPFFQNFFKDRDVFHEHVKEYKLTFNKVGSNFQVFQGNGKERARPTNIDSITLIASNIIQTSN